MNQKRSAWLVWLLFGIISLCFLVTMVLNFSKREAYGTSEAFANEAISVFVPIIFAVTAGLILSHQPRNAIGWMLMIPSVSWSIGGLIESYFRIVTHPPVTPLILLMAWFSGWSWLLLIIPFLNIPLLFPDGRSLSPRWQWVTIFSLVWGALFVIGASLVNTIGDVNAISIQNPLGTIPNNVLEQWIRFWLPGLLVITLLSVASLVIRFRRAGDLERTQIKWLLFACALFAAVYILGGVTNLSDSQTLAGRLWEMAFGVTLLLVPFSIAIAILRYHLWDIDVIIRRTLVYTILVAVLALVYFGGVTLLQNVFSTLSGEQSTASIVLSTLSIAVLFNPLHNRLRTFIDRRFYRGKYDAEKTLQAFSYSLREEVDLDDLSLQIVNIVDKTLRPTQSSLWLKKYKTK
jgi:hypothetical protein